MIFVVYWDYERKKYMYVSIDLQRAISPWDLPCDSSWKRETQSTRHAQLNKKPFFIRIEEFYFMVMAPLASAFNFDRKWSPPPRIYNRSVHPSLCNGATPKYNLGGEV